MARIDVSRGRLLAAVLALPLLCGSWAAQAESWGLTDLMQTLARQKAAKATFTEKKYLAVVDRPLESSGELSYTAPDKLEKRTLSPKPETLLLDGDQLSIEQAGRRRNTINIQSHPEVAAFVESIRGTLAGDLAALQRYYTLDFSGRADAWKLVLVPIQPAMRKVMSRIRVDGTDEALTRIVFEQADGDRSEMHIQRLKTP
ncbi:MAG TPA: outer membrane lipoprotein carrier protein LolA [Aquabacterium sp.]|nr:outer membrane lipoprotein carrier protein LolA [Aquabacterium sp.]